MSEQNKQNHGTPAREEGFYRVLYEDVWTIAFYEVSPYGRGWWLLPGVRGEKTEDELETIIEHTINPQP